MASAGGALPPLGPVRPAAAAASAAAASGPRPGSSSSTSGEEWRRTAGELERRLRFVQEQHADTLRELHAEVEALRRRNRDLQHHLIMREASLPTGGLTEAPAETPASSSSKPRPSTVGPAKGRRSRLPSKVEEPERRRQPEPEQLVEEAAAAARGVQEAAAAAAAVAVAVAVAAAAAGEEDPRREAASPGTNDWSPGSRTNGPPEEAAAQRPEPSKSKAEWDVEEEALPPRRRPQVCDRTTSPILFPSASSSTLGGVKIPMASSNPFLANVLPSHMRKPPTLEECEVVIRQLWSINHMQMQELMYLRSCLEDIHKTKRIPEDYMLAGQLGLQATPRLPKMKKSAKKWILTPLPAAERAVLPALKQTLGNAFAERQKRTQAVQRNRLHRTAL